MAEEITLSNVTILGTTSGYNELVEFHSAPSQCRFQNALVGMEIHTFVRKAENNGAIIQNVTFEGFEENSCDQVSHIKLDDDVSEMIAPQIVQKQHLLTLLLHQTNTGMFDWFTTFEDVHIEDEAPLFDFCPADEVGVHSYLIDLDGSLRETGGGPGSLISIPLMDFVHPSECQIREEGCYAYCESCFRTMRLDVDPSASEDIMLQVCSSMGAPCVMLRGHKNPYADPHDADNHRVFNAHLPQGSYDAVFLNGAGEEIWPSFVISVLEDQLCPQSFEEQDFQLNIPEVDLSSEECAELITNGNAESLDGWLERAGLLTIVPNAGMGGSSTISDAPVSSEREEVVQFLDTRCISVMEGQSFQVHAWVKLMAEDSAMTSSLCDGYGNECPEVRIKSLSRTHASVATLVPTRQGTEEADFQLLHGVFHVDSETANSDVVEFVIRRNRDDVVAMYIDNVSMTPLPALEFTNAECKQELVENGDFAFGDGTFWSQSTATMSIVRHDVEKYRLVLSPNGFGQAFLKSDCFDVGKRYEVRIQFLLMDDNGHFVDCDATGKQLEGIPCPSARLLAYQGRELLGAPQRVVQPLEVVARAATNTLYGVFVATQEHVDADRVMLRLEYLNHPYMYHIDSVSVSFLPRDCSKHVLLNSDMGMGVTSFWTAIGSGSVEWIPEGYPSLSGSSSSGALFAHGRERSGHVVRYNTANFLDERCVSASSTWEVSAQIQVLDEQEEFISCNSDPTTASRLEDACPHVCIQIRDGVDASEVWNVQVMEYVQSEWTVGDWNEFRTRVTLPSTLNDHVVTASSIFIQICNFPYTMSVMVDDFVIERL